MQSDTTRKGGIAIFLKERGGGSERGTVSEMLSTVLSEVGPCARPPLRPEIITVAMPGVTSTRSQLARYAATEGVEVLQNTMASHNRNSRRSACRILWECTRSICTQRGNLSAGRAPKELEEEVDEEWESGEESGVPDESLDPFEMEVYYHALCPVAPRILHNLFPSYEVEEISNSCSANPLHVMMALKEMFTRWWFKTNVIPYRHAHCEAGRSCLGATRDQRSFQREVARAVRYVRQQPEKKHIVLFGCSRGATTCFYTSMKLPPTLASYISLVIVEAPFDTLDHVIQTSCWFPSLARWFYRNFCDYRGSKEQQRAYSYDPAGVSIRCPVAFVLSIKDARVPRVCTEALINGLRQELVPHKVPEVEVLVLSHSKHPAMAIGNLDDQQAYVNFVEMLYDKYCTS